MTLKEQIIAVSAAYAEARKLSLSRVSTIVFGDGKVLDRIQGSADLTTGRYETAMSWFSNNWPDDAVWPAEVTRPFLVVDGVAATPIGEVAA